MKAHCPEAMSAANIGDVSETWWERLEKAQSSGGPALREIARRMGKENDASNVSRVLRGKRPNASFAEIAAMADILGLSLDYVWSGREPKYLQERRAERIESLEREISALRRDPAHAAPSGRPSERPPTPEELREWRAVAKQKREMKAESLTPPEAPVTVADSGAGGAGDQRSNEPGRAVAARKRRVSK